MTKEQIQNEFTGVTGINEAKNPKPKSMEEIKSKYGCATVRTKQKERLAS